MVKIKIIIVLKVNVFDVFMSHPHWCNFADMNHYFFLISSTDQLDGFCPTVSQLVVLCVRAENLVAWFWCVVCCRGVWCDTMWCALFLICCSVSFFVIPCVVMCCVFCVGCTFFCWLCEIFFVIAVPCFCTIFFASVLLYFMCCVCVFFFALWQACCSALCACAFCVVQCLCCLFCACSVCYKDVGKFIFNMFCREKSRKQKKQNHQNPA